MRKAVVITNYTDEEDDILLIKASGISKGCTDNDDFDFTKNELINLDIGIKDYRSKLSRVPTGNKSDITLKKKAKKVLAELLKVICKEINHQHKGDQAILQRTGAVLAKNSNTHKAGLYPFAEQLRAAVGVGADELILKVKKIKGLNNYGTVFAFTEVRNANNDINTWNMAYSTCHSITLTGLKKGTKYLISAAYKGSKGTILNWCSSILFATKVA